MATITLKFTTKGNRFCLCAYTKEKNLRHYKVVDGLINPNFNKWDASSQKFVSRSENDKSNNQTLLQLIKKYQSLLNENPFDSGQELFTYQDNIDKGKDPVQEKLRIESPTSEMTLGKWLEIIIDELLNPTRLKPSGSYQGYVKLLHKLEKEGKLIDMTILSINDNSFIQLAKWINAQPPTYKTQGNNFVGIMKMFRATIARAKKARLTTYVPDFPYMDYSPAFNNITDNAKDILNNGGTVKSLSSEQYDYFIYLDLDLIKLNGGVHMEPYKTLYRDFCVLLYEMKSRPIDIIKLHWDNIAYDKSTKKFTCTYIPAKKKNYGVNGKQTSNPLVIQYLTPKAVEIIMKYKGKSAGGYVFPFSLNKKRWNLDIAEEFRTHYNQANKLQGRINRFLHKVGKHLELPFQLTLYAFRRTSITQAIIDNKIPLPIIAKLAGTSVDMIDKHYANYLHALAAY